MNVDDKLYFINKLLRDNKFHVTGFLLTKDYIFIKSYRFRTNYYFIIPRLAAPSSLDSIDKLMRYNTINDNRVPISFIDI
ncbi:hypothetical protein Mia14_0040 [Candidatus Mancarchaeum acidiphilum]|uniref:Uncharacterized protein n=2 Tax=Candidatus Mancarchaeum acidiphilum TaxID=1920749 RepID=A0A218NLN2_9ARCH|nr:hypothetical protein Mia14_0040 [Candidatus Mancarchaeum acidiphilum]